MEVTGAAQIGMLDDRINPTRRPSPEAYVWDNAAMESFFFSLLKTERTARKNYQTRNEAKADVFDYLERFYNTTRRHPMIGYVSPAEFERKLGLA